MKDNELGESASITLAQGCFQPMV